MEAHPHEAVQIRRTGSGAVAHFVLVANDWTSYRATNSYRAWTWDRAKRTNNLTPLAALAIGGRPGENIRILLVRQVASGPGFTHSESS